VRQVSLEDIACFVHLALFWCHPDAASLSVLASFKPLIVCHYSTPEMNQIFMCISYSKAGGR
jgi:hypothetical protein